MNPPDNQVQLIQKLAEVLSHPPVSLEILPGGLEEWTSTDLVEESRRPTVEFPFLYFEGNLGIPKKVLYKLYMVAVHLFKLSRSISDLCWASTSVILLTNPAHQTALNARKRLVLNGFLEPVKELEFTDLLFRGASECMKQSILWDYRRWLIKRLYPVPLSMSNANSIFCLWTTSGDLQPLPDIPPSVIIEEFNVIRKSCEGYPRNYHAWTHHHFVVDVLGVQLATQSTSSSIYYDILANEYNSLCLWINHHISDYSAMYHLCGLGRLLHDLELNYPHLHSGTLSPVVEDISLAEHALTLMTSYPSHESLWMYLRGAIGLLPEGQRREEVQRIKSLAPQSHYYKQFVAWAQLASVL